MLMTQARRFHFPRRPIKSLREAHPLRTGHRAQRGDLFRTGLLIRQHASIIRQKRVPRNHLDHTRNRHLVGHILTLPP
jgi:hypothetical protein